MATMKEASLSTILFGLLLTTWLMAGPAVADDGQKAFMAQKCNRCHTIESLEIEATIKSEKMKGPDLSAVGTERDATWIMQYVAREVELNGKSHRAKWQGSEKELESIAAWLAAMK